MAELTEGEIKKLKSRWYVYRRRAKARLTGCGRWAELGYLVSILTRPEDRVPPEGGYVSTGDEEEENT